MGALGSKVVDTCLSPFALRFEDVPPVLWHDITKQVVLGMAPDSSYVEEFKSRGVTHVVSYLDPRRRPDVGFLANDFKHLFLEGKDSIREDSRESIGRFFGFIDSMAPGDRVLVHCERGVSRSGTLVVAHVMRSEGLSFIEAFRKVKAARSCVLPNIGFASQLQQLEHELALKKGQSEQQFNGKSLAQYLRDYCNVPTDEDTLNRALVTHDYNAEETLKALFVGEIPRVVYGVQDHR